MLHHAAGADVAVVIVDYGSGNLHSARKAFEYCSRQIGNSPEISVSSDPDVVRYADRIVLPGVGAFADCRRGLDAVSGLLEALTESVRGRGAPFLGICVGMQLMATRGLEHVATQGLGWIEGDVIAIRPSNAALKIPHMGWNNLASTRPHPLLEGIPTGTNGLHAYFVHSYHLQAKMPEQVLARADYASVITAMVGKDNMVGTQFHPEKSQTLGLALITNFLRWKP